MKVRLGDYLIEVITIQVLAKKCGIAVTTFRKHMVRGNIPDANIRTPDIVRADKKIAGTRLYSLFLAEKLSEIFKGISMGKKITDAQKLTINLAFREEREKYKI